MIKLCLPLNKGSRTRRRAKTTYKAPFEPGLSILSWTSRATAYENSSNSVLVVPEMVNGLDWYCPAVSMALLAGMLEEPPTPQEVKCDLIINNSVFLDASVAELEGILELGWSTGGLTCT